MYVKATEGLVQQTFRESRKRTDPKELSAFSKRRNVGSNRAPREAYPDYCSVEPSVTHLNLIFRVQR